MPIVQDFGGVLVVDLSCLGNGSCAGFGNNIHRKTIVIDPVIEGIDFCWQWISVTDAQCLQDGKIVSMEGGSFLFGF